MIFREAVKQLLNGKKIKHKKWSKNKYIMYLNYCDSPDRLSHFLIHYEDGSIKSFSHEEGSKPDENVWKIY